MKIAVGALFFGLSVFLHSIELISSQARKAKPTNLKRLFLHSKGVHFPPIMPMTQEEIDAYPEFKIFNGRPMTGSAATYVKRDDVIFGYNVNDILKPLNLLFGIGGPFAVFKTRSRKWYTLTFNEVVQLGVDRKLQFVQAHDQAHAELHESNHEKYSNADTEASRVAYDATKAQEEICEVENRFTPQEHVALIRRQYFNKYNEEFDRQMRRSSRGCSFI